jgi:hypothetical protein
MGMWMAVIVSSSQEDYFQTGSKILRAQSRERQIMGMTERPATEYFETSPKKRRGGAEPKLPST